jgi:DNA-binding CsgD family transcriptional regulator/cell division protein FtsL
MVTPGEFKFKGGILSISYSVPTYNKYLDINYQYKLEGHSNRWSDWTPKSVSQYENLSFGRYVFMVRARVGNKLTDNIVTYSFKVDRPWFLSNRALLLYLLMMVMAGFAVNAAYKRHYLKKLRNEQLEKDKLIIELRNEQLDREIETKNRELALSKMNILKKNELLNEIKNELTRKDKSDNISSVARLIDRNLNSRRDWEVFVKAFNDADKGFIDKLKSQHPNLTPNDLRFCVYLRMNLSSKEMAPLMNISVKSVETRRYRLRKRMNLPHEVSLVNYILGL